MVRPLGDVGKSIAERTLPTKEVERFAAALADMLCGYLVCLPGGGVAVVIRAVSAPLAALRA